MPVLRHQLRPGAYYDSIVLMQLQRALAELPGVEDAGVVMATAANLAILEANGLLPEEGVTARPDDLLVVVRAEEEAAAREALDRVEELLIRRGGSGEAGEGYRPRSLEAAFQLLPEARWVLVSVPGRHAPRVAREALEAGRNVFLYSDNVPVAEEVALKRRARERGLLVMGPDCGTARVGGVGFGFANRVRRGPVGLVAASGTGLQAVASRLHQLGTGLSHALGTGGRDLSAEVAGATAGPALDLLARDPETEVIVLISKPPAPQVTRRLLARARGLGKPVVVGFLGAPAPARRLGSLWFASGLEDAAALAAERVAEADTVEGNTGEGNTGEDATKPAAASPPAGGPYLRALFSGGTLASETFLALEPFLRPLFSNLSSRPEQHPADPATSRGHTVLDLGADEYTVGRLHPMMDFDLRRRRLLQEAGDPETGLILLDVVLGDGAHPDPAGELAPAVAQALAERPDLEVAVLVVGTGEDPQGMAEQQQRLAAAGARVFHHLGELLDHLLDRLAALPGLEAGLPVPLEVLQPPVAAINVGVETFYSSLAAQGARAVQVDWRPPAGGDEKLMALLERMRS